MWRTSTGRFQQECLVSLIAAAIVSASAQFQQTGGSSALPEWDKPLELVSRSAR
jgi:hypothetical protein